MDLESEDLKFLEDVRARGKLLEVFDLRKSDDSHSKSDRIEVWYASGKFLEEYELTIFIKFENEKIVSFDTK